MTTPNYTSKQLERFWSKVNKNGSIPVHCPELGNCWEWKRTLNHGYGRLRINRKLKYAHQLSWELINGSISTELCVLHKCDNRACCNPSHLFLGTKHDNAKDMIAKGRQRKGTDKPSNKLSEHEVNEIRQRYAFGGVTQRKLSHEYGVSQPTINSIIRFKKWRYNKID